MTKGEDMEWMYGISKDVRGIATLASFDSDERYGFAIVPKFNGKVLVRESEVLFPCGPFNVPTDEVGKELSVGVVMECMIIETRDGLMGVSCRKNGDRVEEKVLAKQAYQEWERVRIPRFMGIVNHWNKKKRYGFIKSDQVRTGIYFNHHEYMVPFSLTGDPYEAASKDPVEGEMVTFDCVERFQRGLRGLAVKAWGKENGGNNGR